MTKKKHQSHLNLSQFSFIQFSVSIMGICIHHVCIISFEWLTPEAHVAASHHTNILHVYLPTTDSPVAVTAQKAFG